ncbi:alginate export family protein [Rhizobium oryzicola]|uniref:Alginate export family protein n=1 Tax=Rhizobium oryzicola TaxID=1232668 RepID=A0ABT8T239_9HYPH|nr:alginate export family protein [Rhizobium oryzicola]MDO1584358.1 alginate export family protein [Rhizobium oryzicola]
MTIAQKQFVLAGISLLILSLGIGIHSADAADSKAQASKRTAIQSNRWQEDWSPLSDPALRTEPLDSLKYIPLFPDDLQSYISLGVTARERFETNDAPAFGTGSNIRDSYLIQRLQFHIDAHLNENWEIFTQFEDARAFDKQQVGPADANEMDLRLAFLSYSQDFDAGTFKARIGRQDFAFDLQRFVSSRDGPNVRQSFDAVWADWETSDWRVLGFISQPVQYRDNRPFDDFSDDGFRFSTARVERLVLGGNELSAYYALYQREQAHYLDASGDEQRHILDVRFAGNAQGFDWDIEAMGQAGRVGSKDIAAWAFGARGGYTFETATWSPRLGLQFDIASGDRKSGDGTIATFNPLFPNGYYFSLGGYTGYANLIHLKPSVTVIPVENLTLTGAIGLLWRETTQDAVYTQPNIPVAKTAGQGDAWTGAYAQFRADYKFNANLTGAVEAVHYQVGQTLRHAGARDSNYLGVELKYSW